MLAVGAACGSSGTATKVVTPVQSAAAATTSVELSWAPTYMSQDTNYTPAEAVALAKKFDLIGALASTFSSDAAAMRAANPSLKLLAYANATFLWQGYTKGVPEAEFAHDAQGKRIRSTVFRTYLMDPGNAQWRKSATSQCKTRAVDAGYNGCLVDLLTMAVYAKGFVPHLPVDPTTGKVYSQKKWRSLLITLAKQYSTDDPSQMIVGNAVSNAFRYWDSPVRSRPIVQALPGAQMEDFLRGSADPATEYPTAAEWLQNVKIIADIEKAGHTALISTKLWATATAAQKAAWQRYSMASFLLVANGHAYFAFTDGRTKAGATAADAPYTMPKALGAPTSAMQHSGSVYLRSFVGGKVVVNPTDHPVTEFLGSGYTDLEGARVSTATLPAHSGDVYLG